MNKPKILVSAFYFNPYKGSESSVGWNIVTRLSNYFDVTVLTGDVSYKRPHERDLLLWQSQNQPIPNLTIEYISPSFFIAFLDLCHEKIPGLWFLWYVAYRKWQKRAYKHALKLHTQKAFNLAHHITMIGFREPGYLWKLPIPFIWGPTSGADNIPNAFYSKSDFSLDIFMRNIFNSLQIHNYGVYKKAAKKSQCILTVTNETFKNFNNIKGIKKVQNMLETGCGPIENQKPRDIKANEAIIFIFSGILIPLKALHLFLYALSSISNNVRNWQVHIIGDGPCKQKWQKIVDKNNLQNKVIWHGKVSHDNALKILDKGHVLVHPSLKEGTPHSVLEALSYGLPVICHDACGMGIAVNETCGIKIPLINPETSIEGFKNAIIRFLNEPELLNKLSSGAIKRSHELSWDNKVNELLNIYKCTLTKT
jgi:glycosyltransferase involved in cell wall biosynthesis